MEYRIISKKKKNHQFRVFALDKNDFTILKLLSSFIFEFIIKACKRLTQFAQFFTNRFISQMQGI